MCDIEVRRADGWYRAATARERMHASKLFRDENRDQSADQRGGLYLRAEYYETSEMNHCFPLGGCGTFIFQLFKIYRGAKVDAVSASECPARNFVKSKLQKQEGIMAGQVKPIPKGFHTVTPYLTVNDGARALDF